MTTSSTTSYTINNVNRFMNDMYDIFLSVPSKFLSVPPKFLSVPVPPKLIVGNTKKDSSSSLHFLDTAFDILKQIKIYAKFTFFITIEKTDPMKVPDIKIEQESSSNSSTEGEATHTIDNPSRHRIEIPEGQNDAYFWNKLLRIPLSTDEKISPDEKIPFSIAVVLDENKSNENIYHMKVLDDTSTDTSIDTDTETETILSSIFHREEQEPFTIKIRLIYTKPNSRVILPESIHVWYTKNSK